MNAKSRAAQRRSATQTGGLDGWWREQWKLTWLWSTCGELKPVSMSVAAITCGLQSFLSDWQGKRFTGIIIVILMDNFNVLETREFPMCWFVYNVYLPETHLAADAEGGLGVGQGWQSVNKLRISPETKLSIWHGSRLRRVSTVNWSLSRTNLR